MKLKKITNEYIEWEEKGHWACLSRAWFNLSPTIPASKTPFIINGGGSKIMDELKGLRIRKLTPCECIRLMGFEDKDYQAMVDSGLSDSAIYHCAGDSIVSPVLVSIFSRMISNDTKLGENTIEEYVEKNVASWKKV